MNEFAYKLIREKKIAFKSGNFFILGFPNNIITLANAATFFHILSMKYGESAEYILKSVANKQIKAIAYSLFNSTNPINMEKADLLLQYLGLFGYGDIKISSVSSSSKEVAFKIKNSTLCLMHLKLFGVKAKAKNAFIEGICAAIAELIFGCNMAGSETGCVANHKEHCYVIAGKNSSKETSSIVELYRADALSTLKSRALANTQAELIKKVSGHNMVSWDDGIFTLWNCPIFVIPSLSLIFLVKSLEYKFGEEVNNLLYHLARVQSREAVKLQVNTLGFRKNDSLLKSILEHSDISGFGSVKLVKADFKNHLLSIEQFYNPHSFYTREFFGNARQPADSYVSGLVAGAAEGFFDVPMESTETKCVAKGDGCCFYQSSQKNLETKYPLEDKFLRIIEEKITTKNFTL